MECKCPEGWPKKRGLVDVDINGGGVWAVMPQRPAIIVLGHSGDCQLSDEVMALEPGRWKHYIKDKVLSLG
jgi:hypothetical protein